jgi:transcription elongation factor Elf1
MTTTRSSADKYIKFQCEGCKQSLEAPSDMVGEIIECPTCKMAIMVPVPTVRSKESLASLTTCPNCGSQHTTRCAMVYVQETSTTRGAGAMVSVNNDGVNVAPIFAAVGTQSMLSELVGPPSTPVYGSSIGGLIGAIIGTIGGIIGGGVVVYVCGGSEPSSFVVGALTIGMVVGAIVAFVGWCVGGFLGRDRDRRKQYEQEYERWSRRWVCNTCGHVWMPGGTVRGYSAV